MKEARCASIAELKLQFPKQVKLIEERQDLIEGCDETGYVLSIMFWEEVTMQRLSNDFFQNEL